MHAVFDPLLAIVLHFITNRAEEITKEILTLGECHQYACTHGDPIKACWLHVLLAYYYTLRVTCG